MVRGLNETGGRNRLKFQKLKSRVKQARARVDVVHKVKSLDFIFDEEDDKRRGGQQETGLLSKTGCLFFDHVQTYLELNTSKAFQRLGKDLAPLSRSLPEVLHHLDAIVTILTTRLREPWGPAHEHALLLVAALAKEVGPELAPRHFRPLMDALLASLQPQVEGPEAASRTMQAMAHLLRHLAKPLLADPDALRRYYGPLLGHKKDFVRRYAAEALAGLLRRMGERALGKHLKAVVRAAATALQGSGHSSSSLSKSGVRRGGDLVDGVALLVFHVVRGVQAQGQLHSKAPPVLRALLRQEARGAIRGGGEEDAGLGRVQRAVVEAALGHLCGHLKPPHAGPLWAEALAAVDTAAGRTDKEGGSDGLERALHVLTVLLRYRKGWLLTDDGVRAAQAGALARVVREAAGSTAAFAALHADTQAEVVAVLLAQWEWRQQQKTRPHRRRPRKGRAEEGEGGPSHGEEALAAALAAATGVVLGPESGADPERAGELATRVLLLGGMQEAEEEYMDVAEDSDAGSEEDDDEEEEAAASASAASALVVDACLRRAVSPSCPPAAWVELVRALMTGQAAALRRGQRHLVEALGQDLVRRLLAGEGEGVTQRMVALRCLAPVLEAGGRPAALVREAAAAVGALAMAEGERGGRPAALVREAAAAVGALAMAEGERGSEELALSSMAALTLTQLWDILPSSGGGTISSNGSVKKRHGKKQQQQKQGSISSRRALIASLWARLRSNPSSLLALRALTGALSSCSSPHAGEEKQEQEQEEVVGMKEALALLAPNLHHPSHLLRLSTLRLLTRLPPSPFLAQPEGEAAVATATAAANNNGKSPETPFVGPCPALALCLELEATPVTIFVERALGGTLGRLEVMAASGRLPREYVAPLAGYCLGMVHVRYAELWKLAATTFAALAHACADATESAAVWARALAALAEVDVRLVAAAARQQRGQQEHPPVATAAAAAVGEMDAVLAAVEAGAWGVESTPPHEDVRLVAFVLDEEEGLVPATAEGQASRLGATDPMTALTSVMDALKRCPPLLGRRSAELCVLFLGFLRHQYFACYSDDPEARELQADLTAALEPTALPEGLAERAGPLLAPGGRRLTAKLARGKLLAFLQLLAVGGVPKRGAGKALLERAFAGFLTRPDGPVASAALDCLLAQKPPHLLPYAATLKALLHEATLRDELVRFDLRTGVQPEHRPLLVPLLVRLLFGRFLAKASKARTRTSKDAPAARRAAIVSFLAGAQGQAEFREFVQLMLRPFLVDAARPFEQPGNLEAAAASPGRRLGFLHLLRSVVRQMGFHVLPFVGAFLEVVLGLLGEAYKEEEEPVMEEEQEQEQQEQEQEEEESVADEEGESGEGDDEKEAADPRPRGHGAGRGRSQGTLRLVATRALADVVTQYAGAFDFSQAAPRLWAILGPSVRRLAAMCSGARQPPALLELLLALAQHDALLPVYAAFEGTLTPALLACLSTGQAPPAKVAGPVLSIVERLGEQDGARFLLPYLPALVQHVALRLQLVAQHPQPSSSGGGQGGKDALLERCLGLLCRTGLLAAAEATATGEAGKKTGKKQAAVDPETLSSLFGLLLPRLRSPRLLREEAKALVLQAYAALVGHMAQPRRDVMLLAKLLGPAGLGPVGFGPGGTLREALVGAVAAMADVRDDCQDLVPGVRVLRALNAPDEEHVEGRDLDVVMPQWTRLAEDGAWAALMREAEGSGVALVPLVAHTLASLHDEEVVVRVAAGAGLRAAVRAAASGGEGEWLWLLQSGLLPGLRAGMGCPKDTVRQGYVMVLTELVRAAQSSPSSSATWLPAHAETFHGDLGLLMRADDTEADFFHNIVHIQVHRRARALQRLRKTLTVAAPAGEQGEEETCCPFSPATLVHVLLPLASQPLLGVDRTVQAKAADPTLLHEASAATALVARQLSWSHYYALIRRFLREIALAEGGAAARDKALVTGLCQVLDAFHFPMAPPFAPAPASAATVAIEAKEPVEEEEGEDEEKDGAEEEKEDSKPRKQAQQQPPKHDVVWRAVTTQLLPSLRALLLKEAKDKEGGGKVQVLRAPLALAVLQLIRLLPPQAFDVELTRLLMTVCGALRSRDSSTRDAAREVLGRMAQALGPTYLGAIIRELSAALQEGGYMLHVRVFTLHHVLRALEQVYAPPIDAPSFPVPGTAVAGAAEGGMEPVHPPLDACLPEAVALLEADLFGEAQGAKEAEAHVKSTAIKEAKGQKALDALEILARLLLFRPTYAVASPHDPAVLSSVHALIKPFLLQLHESESPRTHGRVNEALQRVVGGLAVNPSLKAEEVLLYVYGLVSPFVLVQEGEEGGDGEENAGGEDSESEDEEEALAVIGKSGRQGSGGGAASKQQQSKQRRSAATWLPVDATLKLAVEAKTVQRRTMREEARVLDGKNAPKLTGWGRHGAKQRKAEGGMFGSPAALAAGVLGLRLLHSYLKRLGALPPTLVPMLDPYVSLLARCVRRRVNDAIVLLALKSLALLLKSSAPLPSLPRMAPRLVRSSMSLLTMAGGPANSRDEVVQSCMRILTILVASAADDEEQAEEDTQQQQQQQQQQQLLPIPAKSLGALVSLLRAAALDYDHVNAPFALIRALVNRRAMVPEMYDLMEQMLAVSVTSRRPAVRQMGAQVVVGFLLHYPLTPAKVARFLQQAVRNLGYEYEEGRAAALGLLRTLVGRLPVPVLDEHAQVLFLPMVLRLVNDPSPTTRAAAAEAMAALLRRVSGDVFHVLLEYQAKWMDEGGEEALARAAAQSVGLFVGARPDLVKRGELGRELLRRMARILGRVEKKGVLAAGAGAEDLESPRERHGEAALGWELAYQCLTSLSAVYDKVPSTVEAFLAREAEGRVLLAAASELLCYRHAWVRLAASRFVGHYLDRRSPTAATNGNSAATSSFFLSDPAAAAALARRLCVQIDRPSLSPELSLRAVKSLVFLASGLAHGAAASSSSSSSSSRATIGGDEEGEEGEEGEEEGEEVTGDGGASMDTLSWVFHRVSYMARRKGEDRRCAVFRFFAAMAALEGPELVRRFLPHMLGPLYRATTDGQSEVEAASPGVPGSGGRNNAAELAREVMGILEERAGAAAYLEALSSVQRQAALKRERRKRERAVEAVADPEAAARRKVAKNAMKREGEKRKKIMKRKRVGSAEARMMLRREREGRAYEEGRKRRRGLVPSEGDKDQGM